MSKTEKYPPIFSTINMTEIAKRIGKSKNYFSSFEPYRDNDTEEIIVRITETMYDVQDLFKALGNKSK